MESDKILYRQLRDLDCRQLWEQEVPGFDRASPAERTRRAALIRAVGVVVSEKGTPGQRDAVRTWLRGLLGDPSEKVRRYAIAALPKFGAGDGGSDGGEADLLMLLRSTPVERERRYLGKALNKIGGAATLDAVGESPGLLAQTDQKLRANVARILEPSSVRMDAPVIDVADLRIQLRCRRGLEDILRGEVQDRFGNSGRFRIERVQRALVTLVPTAPFCLADLYLLRCFATVGFVLGTVRETGPGDGTDALAAVLTGPRAVALFGALTQGSWRYRLDFVDAGHQRGGVARVVERAYARCPQILNDARSAPWAVDVHPIPESAGGRSVELRPKLVPDPRLGYRQDDIPAASHPPLAAAMARIAGRQPDETVWDPFCGSGLELVECGLLGGVKALVGTDTGPAALEIARANVAAAGLKGVGVKFALGDFREHARIAGLGPGSISLIITNPPMGRRVRVPNLRGLIADLFSVAATVLRPGGRLVFANPVNVEPVNSTLRLRRREVVDLGGFDCRLELHENVGPGRIPTRPRS